MRLRRELPDLMVVRTQFKPPVLSSAGGFCIP